MEYFNTLPNQTRNHLLELADAVQGIVPISNKTFHISTTQLHTDKKHSTLLDEIAEWAQKGQPYLYYLLAYNKPDLNMIEKAFIEARTVEKGDRKYARFNKLQSRIIYVGCSKDLAKRIKEHLGFGAKGTYALNLAYWANEIDILLELTCAEYPQETPADILQALEDTLWDNLKPMFGRKGQR